jgi:hypothetical protein
LKFSTNVTQCKREGFEALQESVARIEQSLLTLCFLLVFSICAFILL